MGVGEYSLVDRSSRFLPLPLRHKEGWAFEEVCIEALGEQEAMFVESLSHRQRLQRPGEVSF